MDDTHTSDKEYWDLSPKQRDIIDAWVALYDAHGEEPDNVDVVDMADADPSYTQHVLNEYSEIARSQLKFLNDG